MKLCALALAGSAVAFAAPMLTLDPKSGPPTSYTVVAGTGFTGGETVDIYFDTTEVATATVRSTGEFSGVDVPISSAAIPGVHTVTAVGSQTKLAAQESFLVRADWKEFSRGPERRGYNPTENVLSVATVQAVEIGQRLTAAQVIRRLWRRERYTPRTATMTSTPSMHPPANSSGVTPDSIWNCRRRPRSPMELCMLARI